jgi:predicted phosphodiesterase
MKLEILGSIDGQQHYNIQQIVELLEEQHTELSYGAAFMGRPGTCLYAGTNEIIKLRNELDLNELRARRFLNHTLAQEQKLGVHHPHKTWFLAQQEDGNFKIGNICPRLTPLHILPEQSTQDINTKFVYLEKLYRCYFQIASQFSARLDEGLSNFGIDHNEQLFYLDDDIYTWDNFISFAHILGVLIRNNAWLNAEHAVILGSQLQLLISEFFEDSHTSVMVARKLRDVFIPDKTRRCVLEIIIEQLQEKKVITKVQPYNQDCIAILSDIHANLPALEAVLDYLANRKISQGMVLGDTVGYGPHPIECIERLQATQLQVIKGNHDHAAATGDTKRGMSSLARWCIEWTIPLLSTTQRQWLNNLPLELDSAESSTKTWLAVHGAPLDPNYFYAYVYQMTYEENLDVLSERNLSFCFHGHSHIQGMYVRNNKLKLDSFVKPDGNMSLEGFKHALICPGAVGQPRDGCIGAQFAIYHQNTHQIEFILLDYDMDKTIADMQALSFPDTLWQRLQRGA